MKLTREQVESLASGLKNKKKRVITVADEYLKIRNDYIPYQQKLLMVSLGYADSGDILWQQAFNWFRDKFGIDNACMKDRYMIEKNGMFPAYYYTNSFEEAQEQCLIKLINYVRNKSVRV